jgi:hypothetical protein
MTRTNDREVAMVKRHQFGLTEPLDDGENGCVNEAERQIPITIE